MLDIHTLLFVCWKWANLLKSKNLKVDIKETDFSFSVCRTLYIFCFLNQHSLKSQAGAALFLSMLTPGLTRGLHVFQGWVRGWGWGKKNWAGGRTWVNCIVSVLSHGVLKGPSMGFKSREIFQCSAPYLTTTQSTPSTCNAKTSLYLHFTTLCWFLSNPGVQDRRNSRSFKVASTGHHQHHFSWMNLANQYKHNSVPFKTKSMDFIFFV